MTRKPARSVSHIAIAEMWHREEWALSAVLAIRLQNVAVRHKARNSFEVDIDGQSLKELSAELNRALPLMPRPRYTPEFPRSGFPGVAVVHLWDWSDSAGSSLVTIAFHAIPHRVTADTLEVRLDYEAFSELLEKVARARRILPRYP